ncbi:MAG: N-acetyltransferase [Planctomycetota bacterium]
MVDRLRAKPGVISLVAESDGEIAGHVLLSPVVVEGSRAGRALALGPMAVHPDHQQKGLGRALVRHATVAAEAASADVLVVLGHPGLLPAVHPPARASSLLTTYGVPDDVFLALPLVGDATVPRGLVRYHDAFAALD